MGKDPRLMLSSYKSQSKASISWVKIYLMVRYDATPSRLHGTNFSMSLVVHLFHWVGLWRHRGHCDVATWGDKCTLSSIVSGIVQCRVSSFYFSAVCSEWYIFSLFQYNCRLGFQIFIFCFRLYTNGFKCQRNVWCDTCQVWGGEKGEERAG